MARFGAKKAESAPAPASLVEPLTDRELEVLQLLGSLELLPVSVKIELGGMLLDLLAAIPSVVCGFIGLTIMNPLTTPDRLDQLMDALRRHGRELMES